MPDYSGLFRVVHSWALRANSQHFAFDGVGHHLLFAGEGVTCVDPNNAGGLVLGKGFNSVNRSACALRQGDRRSTQIVEPPLVRFETLSPFPARVLIG
ncbi:MAG: hypothetical protein WDN76_06275 [Alphaproteobacteria bacterium]